MPRLLLVYASTHGQSEAVALRLASQFRGHDLDVDVFRVEDLPAALDPATYEGVVAGGPIYYDRPSGPLLAWLARHGPHLGPRPLGLFTVCMSVLDGRAAARQKVEGYTTALVQAAGHAAAETAVFAGALHYRAYSLLLRWVIRRISRSLVGQVADDPTDTSRDHVYTDWSAVDAFACDLARRTLAVPPTYTALWTEEA